MLPDLTDEWVDEASEFDTVDELRADIRKRLETMQKLQAQMAARDKVLEAAADLVPIPAPEVLVDDETRRRVEDLAHRLSHQNASLEAVPRRRRARSPRRSSTRCAPARCGPCSPTSRCARSSTQEAIEASDDEVDAEVERLAERLEQKLEKVRRDLERRGVLETVRSDLARGKALEFLVEHATVVDEEGNVIDLTLPDEQPSSEATDETIREDTIAASTDEVLDETTKGPEA